MRVRLLRLATGPIIKLHMRSLDRICAVSLVAVTLASLAACQRADGIDTDGAKFDAIAEDATINLVGNEPFWAIEIVPQGGAFEATYSHPDNIEGSAFAAARFAGNNGLGFSGEMEGEPVQIALTPGECSDTMSDRNYPYTATVAIGGRTLLGCGYTSDQPYSGEE